MTLTKNIQNDRDNIKIIKINKVSINYNSYIYIYNIFYLILYFILLSF